MRASSKGSIETSHRNTGDAIGNDCQLEDFDMRCTACGTLQTEPFDADLPWRAQMRDVTCLECGRCGTMSKAPTARKVA